MQKVPSWQESSFIASRRRLELAAEFHADEKRVRRPINDAILISQ
jgi:hypothetical protein